ncbi:MAG: FMN-binding protein, partial [Erysipelotrichaceae bacterium]|nr:FMN-binding protein [Erysipelotrichaceae bacterium]
AQTYDVDAVSGATITSTSIKKAAKAAMTEAGLVTAEAGGCETLTLDSINDFLNTSADLGEGTVANAVAIIPINHVNGPREERNFYAFVNYKYTARKYIKYQITYLSCTCRSADVNYWMTAYVELTLPESGKLEDSEIRTLTFDYDGPDGHYLAGHWGDSNPTPAGHTYEQIKEEYISYFIDKNYGYISTLNFVEDIAAEDYTAGEGREGYSLDTFVGSSVSTNNVIRMLNALFEYHGTDKFFNE